MFPHRRSYSVFIVFVFMFSFKSYVLFMFRSCVAQMIALHISYVVSLIHRWIAPSLHQSIARTLDCSATAGVSSFMYIRTHGITSTDDQCRVLFAQLCRATPVAHRISGAINLGSLCVIFLLCVVARWCYVVAR